jgi:hypothetical protein
MKALTFPNGSIGALLYNEPAAPRNAAIPIPREVARDHGVFVPADDKEERWVHAAMAATVILAIALIAWVAIQ